MICEAVRSGCTDPAAFNYDATANQDDDSCVAVVLGCTDPAADNYDATANQDDDSCVFLGCMNPNADNHDATANQDDGSCTTTVVTKSQGAYCDYTDGSISITGVADCDAAAVSLGLDDTTATADQYAGYPYGCFWYNNMLWFNTRSSLDRCDRHSKYCLCHTTVALVPGCTDPDADNYDAAANSDDDSCTTTVAAGCTNPAAENYDATANHDDGSCTTTVVTKSQGAYCDYTDGSISITGVADCDAAAVSLGLDDTTATADQYAGYP